MQRQSNRARFGVTDIRVVREQVPLTLKKHGFKLVNFAAGRAVADWADEAQVNLVSCAEWRYVYENRAQFA